MKQQILLLLCFFLFLFSIGANSQTIPSYVPTNGLVGYWPFNGNANDESGNGNHGTVNGATLTSDRNGGAGKAYSFDGNDWIDALSAGPTGTGITLSYWFKSNQANLGGIFCYGGNNWGTQFEILHNYWSAQTTGTCNGPALHNSGSLVSFNSNQFLNNNFHHVVVILPKNASSVSSLYTYIDGSLINNYCSFANYGAPAPNIGNDYPIRIGKNINYGNGTAYFSGTLDDITIYNRALTQQEITALYTGVPPCSPTSSITNLSIPSTSLPYTWNGLTFNNSGSQTATLSNASGCDSTATLNLIVNYTLPTYVPTNALVGYWPFNGNANDESGNGNHGTVNGATLTTDRNGNSVKAYGFQNGNIVCANSNIPQNLNFTISYWFKETSQNGLISEVISLGSSNSTYWGTISSSGGFCMNYGRGCGSTGSSIISKSSLLNQWHHIVIKSNGLGINSDCYLDGIYIGNSTNANSSGGCSVSNLYFGVDIYSLPEYFQGNLDDIAIYNRALTQQEITQLYTGTVTHSIDASSGANGSISPSGSTSVNSGASQTYTFTPNPGYWIDSVIVNGTKVQTASSYTFNNVTSNQNIRVTYRSLAAALAAANICTNDSTVATVNLPANSLVRATTYYSNIYLFNQNNTGNAYKYNVNDRKYTAIADKPTPCIESGVAEANGKIYCFNTNGTTQAYDISSNTWQTITNQPSSSTSSMYAASINNKVYVLGTNANNQNTFTQYNPQNNTYTSLTNPNQNTSQSRLVAYNNLIYKIGGINTTTNTTSTAVEVYNPSNNTWISLPDLPEALSHVGATNYDNKLYVFGGKQNTATNSSNSNKVYVYDIAGNTWYAQSNTLNYQRANIEAKTANGLVYLFGGTDTSNTTSNQAIRYFCKDQLCTCKWAEYVCNGVSQSEPCPLTTPSINSLSQDTTANTGSLYSGTAATNSSVTLNYTGANGAAYNARSIASTSVTGLTATLAAGTLNNGNGTLILNITGTPTTNGTASFSITIGGKTCVFTREVNLPIGTFRTGTVFCNGTPTAVVDVTNPITGRTWMDRNLGASRAATSSTDTLAFGDLYQWGRGADGHQCRNSLPTTILSTTLEPGHGLFIAFGNDWLFSQNPNLWKGIDGINNPCPFGYRLPTKIELEEEIISWNSNYPNLVTTFKPVIFSGMRDNVPSIAIGGSGGTFWSGSIESWNTNISPNQWGIYIRPYSLGISDSTLTSGNIFLDDNSFGRSIRCIKEQIIQIVNLDTIGSKNTGDLYSGYEANVVKTELIYSNATNSNFDEIIISSTGVLGLEAKIGAGRLNTNGSLIFNITGKPLKAGIAFFTLNLGGKICKFSRIVKDSISYAPSSIYCDGSPTIVNDITNPITGRTWMDRNLGASRAATSSTDSLAYGDLYQWGRATDRSQCRNSITTRSYSSVDQPQQTNGFILHSDPYTNNNDWRLPKNDNLWQGINGINNPCPIGYRLPTKNELELEKASWSQANSEGAFSSPLKLTNSGSRDAMGGNILSWGSGLYWTSSITGSEVWSLYIEKSFSGLYPTSRIIGGTVRCIKN